MRLKLSTFDRSLEIITDAAECWTNFSTSSLFKTFLPCVTVEILTENVSSQSDFTLIHVRSNQKKLAQSAEYCVFIYDSWDTPTPPSYIYIFIEEIADRLRQEVSVFSFRASAVEVNGKAVALLADNWHGKTSSAVHIAINYGAKIIANNRLLIRGTEVWGGSQLFDVKASFWHYFPELTPTLKGLVSITTDDRYTFEWPEICLNHFPVPLTAIIVAHINSGASETQKIPLSNKIWYLFRQVSCLIRGDVILFDGQYASPSYDNDELKQMRLAWIRMLALKVPLLYVAGSLDFISFQVNNFQI